MLTVGELVGTLGAELLCGRPESAIAGLNSLADACEGELSFFSNPRYLGALKISRASAVLVPPGFRAPDGLSPAVALLAVENPSIAFARLLERFAPPPTPDVPGVAPTAVIGANVRLGTGVSIQPYAVIEDGTEIGAGAYVGAHCFIGAGSSIGEGSRIYPHVTIRERTQMGRRVIVHSGTVIGSDGFGFEFRNGRHVKIPQTGIVQIDDDVEIGANCTIDRARFGRTHIGEGTKIDNLVQIAHNVVIGPHCILVSQVGISGSTRLGKYVTLAGQVGIVGHVEIGDQATVAAKSGVSKDVPARTVMFGYPAQPLKDMKESLAHVGRLPKLLARVKRLEAELATLTAAVPQASAESHAAPDDR
jgi:UDP-3-O-[3-hydroxymyristoyl] glucosamine N-acyltransferase